MIEAQRDYAATVLTVDAVADFWRLEDFARRKARAFAGVTQLAMLEHPELNSKSANPMVGDARDQLLAAKDDTRRVYGMMMDGASRYFARAGYGADDAQLKAASVIGEARSTCSVSFSLS